MVVIKYLILLHFGFGFCCGQNFAHENDVIQPCPDLDLNCIGSFFAQHSNCEPVSRRHQEDLYWIDSLDLPIRRANLTFIWKDASITGLDSGEVRKFKVNRNTNRLMLEVAFRKVKTYSPTAIIKYYSNKWEPYQLTDFFGIVYEYVYLTAYVPFDPLTGVKWDQKAVYSYFEDPRIPYFYGDALYNDDPEVQDSFFTMIGNPQKSVKEAMVVVGPYYFTLFFNNNICKPL